MIKDNKDVERITREIKILKKVRHPNVIQLYEVSIKISSQLSFVDYRDREGAFHDHGAL